jgi:signal transduction histidine kinase
MNMNMTKNRFSIKWKLIIWLSLIGFITSIAIHFILLMLGSSNIGYTMRQQPISQWQKSHIATAVKAKSSSQKEINQYLETLVNKSPYQVFNQSTLFTQLTINAIAFIDLDSQLVFQTKEAKLVSGDVGAQIAIQSRDDLSDALIGHHNSGIESLGENNYLVINSVINNNDEIIGATVSWQSWQYQQDKMPFFYISILQGLKLSLFNTLGSFFWIIPSTFILGWLVARVITKRYQHLYRTIEDWGNGNLTSRITTSGNDEIAISFQRLNLMAEKLVKHQKELKHLVSIKERQHLAAELHDTVKQQLFASNLQLSSAAQQIDNDISGAKQSLSKAIEQNRTAFRQVNDLIFTLSPIQIGSNLKEALIKALESWQQSNQILLSNKINISIELTEIQQQIIFRSIMEALQNVSKHSNAKHVGVNVSHDGNIIYWKIIDDGDIQGNENNVITFGQGLSLMQKRIESLDGKLSINQVNGFELNLELPIV